MAPSRPALPKGPGAEVGEFMHQTLKYKSATREPLVEYAASLQAPVVRVGKGDAHYNQTGQRGRRTHQATPFGIRQGAASC